MFLMKSSPSGSENSFLKKNNKFLLIIHFGMDTRFDFHAVNGPDHFDTLQLQQCAEGVLSSPGHD